MNSNILKANLQALSKTNSKIFSYLDNIDLQTKKNKYTFCKSKSGEKVPVYSQITGNSKPLHSTVDPKREAQRLVSTVLDGYDADIDIDFIVLLGLGGGFVPQAALEQTNAQMLVIDFRFDDIIDLFLEKDYTHLLDNERFTLLIDPSNEDIKNFLLEHYSPSLCGGIKTIPLRTRTEFDISLFNNAADAIQEAIETISSDYSVQVNFGRRWFSNIIRNIKFAPFSHSNQLLKNIKISTKEAAVVAAGPSLNKQLDILGKYKSQGFFIISSDTALPVLLNHNIKPDAVVSIDCQHISYYHFLGLDLKNIPLILDISSPPMLFSFTTSPFFFSSNHPLALYISQNWQNLPKLDTSGGNVTYACLSFTEFSGAKRITLFGADFSYINSETYARGTYVNPFFEKKQNRLSPKEALLSSFLYRSPFIPAENSPFFENALPAKNDKKKNYYETSSLRFYRKKLEEKTAVMNAHITVAKGQGTPLNLPYNVECNTTGINLVALSSVSSSSYKNIKMNGIEFLEHYRGKIAALPSTKNTGNYFKNLSVENRQILTTLLPFAAAVKHRSPLLKAKDLIEETKLRCIKEIDLVLKNE